MTAPMDRRLGVVMYREAPEVVRSVLFRMTTNCAFVALGAYR